MPIICNCGRVIDDYEFEFTRRNSGSDLIFWCEYCGAIGYGWDGCDASDIKFRYPEATKMLLVKDA